jgi:hypothetical protein
MYFGNMHIFTPPGLITKPGEVKKCMIKPGEVKKCMFQKIRDPKSCNHYAFKFPLA